MLLKIETEGCSAYKDLNEIGITYFIGSTYRRKGYATEAARACADYFLKQYKNISRIIATVRTENNASCKTVEKSGFLL
jgi:RimJ/RimL family protein N-acetyltransferase